jgi:WD40 repeat protein
LLTGHGGEIADVAITPDNRRAITASSDGTARIWPLKLEELMELAKTASGRNLSDSEWKLYFSDQPYHKTFPELTDLGSH